MAPTARALLSVCIIAKDEEPNIGRALESVRGVADEAIVLDTGSRDRTVAIAREMGARVESFAWTDDFSEARNYALRFATGAWILILDADEAIGTTFREGFRDAVASTKADAFAIPILSIKDGAIQHRLRITRLFRNRKGYRFEGRIHEQIDGVIQRAGGVILEADLAIEHFGYTPDEDRRKQRRQRNLRMIQEELAKDPKNPRHWHYLGLEYMTREDLTAARALFERVVVERPDHLLAGWSASLLAEVLRRQREYGAAWRAAEIASHGRTGNIMGLVRQGEIALHEGDYVTADECAKRLVAMPTVIDGDVARRVPAALEIAAGALWEKGDRAGARAALEAAVRAHPDDAILADKYARRIDAMLGVAQGAAEALRATGSRIVAAALTGSFVRRGDWARALAVADRASLPNMYYAHALLRTGRTDEAFAFIREQGAEGALHTLLWGLETRDDALVTRALDDAPPVWVATAERLARDAEVAPEHAWLAWEWAHYWLEYRGLDLAKRLAARTPGTQADHHAGLAVLLFECGEARDAMLLALEHHDHPAAQEVLGLGAYAQGDAAAAAHFLTPRALRGDAPVRVHMAMLDLVLRGGGDAVERRNAAAEYLEAARNDRPCSLLLRGFTLPA